MKCKTILIIISFLFPVTISAWSPTTHVEINRRIFARFLEKMAGTAKYDLAGFPSIKESFAGKTHYPDSVSIGSIHKWETPIFDLYYPYSINYNIPDFQKDAFQNLEDWVKTGGFDGDQPEWIMALKHFYDPIFTPRYLIFLGGNPSDENCDAISWGSGYNEDYSVSGVSSLNAHCFHNGLKLFKAAMENDRSELPSMNISDDYDFGGKRENWYAHAFRSLGETLHMIGDMGLPAHTRNDSHPGIPLGDMKDDPVEDGVNAQIVANVDLNLDVAPDLIFKKKDLLRIAQELAIFSNGSFFSDSTVNIPKIGITNARNYPNPGLETSSLIFEEDEFSLPNSKILALFPQIGKVPLCVETGSSQAKRSAALRDNNNQIEYPTSFIIPMDEDWIKPHAQVLIPPIVRAGIEVIDQFFPTMETSLTFDPKTRLASGTLVHKIANDLAWIKSGIGEIKYTGPGGIYQNGTKTWPVEFNQGVFGPIPLQNLSKGDKIQLMVFAGGRCYKTPEYVAQENGLLESNGNNSSEGNGSGGGISFGQVTQQALAVGPSTKYVLMANGAVWGWGAYLGDGKITNPVATIPQKIPGLANIKKITMSGDNLLALDTSSAVWALGPNNGSLGNGGTNPTLTPEKLAGLPMVVDIWGDDTGHAYARESSGQFWAWGRNSFRELGVTDFSTSVYSPKQVVVSNASASFDARRMAKFWPGMTSFARTDDGRCVFWGCRQARNYYENSSAFSPSSILQIINPKMAEYGHVVLDEDGRVWTWGNQYWLFGHLPTGYPSMGIYGGYYKTTPSTVPSLPKIKKILVVDRNAMALDEAGNLWEWGWSSEVLPGKNLPPVDAQAGLPGQVVDFALGNYVALLQTNSGEVYELLLRTSTNGRKLRKITFSGGGAVSTGSSPTSPTEPTNPTTPITPVVTPNAPANVFVYAYDRETVISWDTVAGAKLYNLYWSTSPMSSKASGQKIANVTSSYRHQNLTNGTTYYYLITAENEAGESLETPVKTGLPLGSMTIVIGTASPTIIQSEPVSFFVTYMGVATISLASEQVILNKTGTANASNVSVFGNSETRIVTLSGISGDGTLGISLPAGTAVNAANQQAPAAGPSGFVAVDNTGPSVVSVQTTATNVVDVSFNEPLNQNDSENSLNFSISGSGKGNLTANPDTCTRISGSKIRLSWNFGAMVQGGDITITVNSAVRDIVGNPMGTPNIGTYTGTPSNKAPIAKIASPSQNAVFLAGSNIPITMEASDPDGCIAKLELYLGAKKIGESATSPYTFSWENVPAGTYSLTGYAIDNSGACANSNMVDIIVNPAEAVLPNIQITSPAMNSEFSAGSQVAIVASATDPGGSIAKVEFYQGSTMLGESATSPYTFSWENVPPGKYSLTANAIDNSGGCANSNVIDIVVNPAEAIPPVIQITSPAMNSEFSAGSQVTIVASATDPDGSIAKVEFYQGSTLLGESATSPYTLSWENVPVGNYSLTAYAIDDSGAYSSSNVIDIIVKPTDTVLPVLISSKPASGSIVVDISASNTVALYFSEPIKKGSSGNIWIKSRTENTLISSIPVTDRQIQVEENILKISPTFMFQSSQTIKGQADDYKIEIDAGAIKDLAGNSFGGLDESSALYFGVKKVWFTLANWSFEALAEHASVVFNGKIWVIGGVNNTPTSVSTVYSSSDGVTWALVSNNKFLPRWQHRAVVFNNQMWILGGMGDLSTSFRTEAWSSSDGINWSLRSTASCLNRSRHEALVYNNKIWIMGGKRVNTYFNDVWSSPDGINWSQVTASASWAPAGAFGSLVFDNKMWLIIGNKVWNSVDGANWSLVSILPSFWYLAASAYVYDGKMWVVGGGTDGNLNSAYFSKDGISWTAVSDPSQDLPGKHTGVLFNNRMFILGGFREPNSMTKEVRWAW